MNSRMEKYYNDEHQEYSRSKRNSNLYKEVYGSYSQFEHLPVSDNVSEIDAEKLKEIVTSREEYHKKRNEQVESKEEPIKRYEENKIYDINELIEKARKSKPRVTEEKKEHIESYNFLKTLESNELLKSQIKEAVKEDTPKIENTNISNNISSNNISNTNIITDNLQKTNTLSLEILSDLKPTGDTVVMEPVANTMKNNTSDIPIEESVKKEEEDKAFYSGSYKFSKKDFFDDDFQETKKGSSFAKALIIIVVLSICITGIYFLIDFLGSR